MIKGNYDVLVMFRDLYEREQVAKIKKVHDKLKLPYSTIIDLLVTDENIVFIKLYGVVTDIENVQAENVALWSDCRELQDNYNELLLIKNDLNQEFLAMQAENEKLHTDINKLLMSRECKYYSGCGSADNCIKCHGFEV